MQQDGGLHVGHQAGPRLTGRLYLDTGNMHVMYIPHSIALVEQSITSCTTQYDSCEEKTATRANLYVTPPTLQPEVVGVAKPSAHCLLPFPPKNTIKINNDMLQLFEVSYP